MTGNKEARARGKANHKGHEGHEARRTRRIRVTGRPRRARERRLAQDDKCVITAAWALAWWEWSRGWFAAAAVARRWDVARRARLRRGGAMLVFYPGRWWRNRWWCRSDYQQANRS